MAEILYQKKTKIWRKCVSSFVAFTFLLSMVSGANAQYITNLPKPGEMVLLSPAFEPAVLKGMTIHPENPLQFDFIVDRGQDKLADDALKAETQKLLKYFLAAMTIPDDDSWVNLSPYENDRIIPDMLGTTDMGKAMLEQDYLLKQLSASLTNPQEEIGKNFWNTVYKKAFEKFGTTTIPINTFNKVWIIPDKAVILEDNGYAFIGETHLKVMLDEDYTSVKENLKNKKLGTDQIAQNKVEELSSVSSEVVREIIIPELEKEINQGKNFAAVRQIYNSVILATWYKQTLKDSLLGRIYVDKNKIMGVDIAEKDIKQKVYEQYLAAFRKGVYNLIKEDYDLASKETLPRKYFSGGLEWKMKGVVRSAKGDANASSAIVRSVQANLADGRLIKAGTLLEEPAAAPVVEKKASAASAEGASSPLQVQQQQYQQKLQAVFDERKLDLPSQAYFRNLVRAFFNPTTDEKPLIIKVSPTNPGNFKPSALLTAQERTDLLGLITYSQLLQQVAPQLGQFKYDVVLSLLDAGLGTSVGREDYIKKLGRTKVGAKGTDLGFRGILSGQVVSIAEVKLLRTLRDIESGAYPMALGGQIVFQPVVSPDSKPSYDELMLKPFLPDILRGQPKDKARTYGQVLAEMGVSIEPRIVPFYPGLTLDTNEPSWQRESSGSHGEVGFKIMLETLTMQPKDRPVYKVFANGDGTNNMADHYILDWMTQNNVPIVMVSTAKTPLDKKGGQIGVEFLENGQVRVKMLELASARSNGQALDFEHVGLQGGIGEVGKQDFNTNIAVINQTLLAKMMQDLLKEVFKGDVTAIQKIFTPDLIASEKANDKGKMFVQLEGPIGTVLTNVHNFFATSTDPAVKRIMKRYKVDRMLRVVHVEANNRTRFFTPLKSALDFVLQTYSDYYRLNRGSWMLEDSQPGLTPPVINLTGSNSKDKYYEDVSNMINSFGRFSVIGLKELTVNGRVLMPNAVFQGKVTINNKTGQMVDLTTFQNQIGTTSDGRLLFKDISIEIAEDGSLVKKPIASSAINEVDIQVNGEGDEISTVKYNPKAGASSSAVTAPQKVLLVEDNPVNLMIAKQMLENLGHAVVEAENGQEALDAVAKAKAAGTPFTLILTDIEMPVMDGIAFIKQVGDQIPIVITSDNPDKIAEATALANAAVKATMTKPILAGPNALEEAIAKAIPVASSAVGQATVLVVADPFTAAVLAKNGYSVIRAKDNAEANTILSQKKVDVIVSGDGTTSEDLFKGLAKAVPTKYLFATKDNVNDSKLTVLQGLGVSYQEKTANGAKELVSKIGPALEQKFESDVPVALRLADVKPGQDGNITISFPSREKKMVVEVKMDTVGGQNRLSITPSEDGDFEIGRLEDVVNRDFWVSADGTIKKADNQGSEFRGVRFEIGEDGKSIVFKSGSGQGTIDYSTFAAATERKTASSGAVAKEEPVGGIDFDPSLLNLQIKRNGKGVPLPLPQQNIEKINIDGLYPVIINIQPATIQNFPFLSSVEKGDKVPQLSMR